MQSPVRIPPSDTRWTPPPPADPLPNHRLGYQTFHPAPLALPNQDRSGP